MTAEPRAPRLDLDADHGFVLERHDSVSSTQDVLRSRLAAGSSVAGVVVRARHQSAGHGRRGSVWSSRPGGSYQSVGLPVPGGTAPGRPAAAALLPLALSIGIARALTQAGARTLVKWPNDLVLAGRKLGGVIVEALPGALVAGIGVNVDNEAPAGAAGLRGWDADLVGDLVLHGVRHALASLAGDPELVVDAFEGVDWLRGKAVLLAGAVEPGRGAGIDTGGCLLLVDGAGTVSRHRSGHVIAVDGVAWSVAPPTEPGQR